MISNGIAQMDDRGNGNVRNTHLYGYSKIPFSLSIQTLPFPLSTTSSTFFSTTSLSLSGRWVMKDLLRTLSTTPSLVVGSLRLYRETLGASGKEAL